MQCWPWAPGLGRRSPCCPSGHSLCRGDPPCLRPLCWESLNSEHAQSILDPDRSRGPGSCKARSRCSGGFQGAELIQKQGERLKGHLWSQLPGEECLPLISDGPCIPADKAGVHHQNGPSGSQLFQKRFLRLLISQPSPFYSFIHGIQPQKSSGNTQSCWDLILQPPLPLSFLFSLPFILVLLPRLLPNSTCLSSCGFPV